MGDSTLKEKTAKGLFWGGMSNGVQQLLSLFFGIFLARLLTPSDYGLVGMLSIFSALAAILQDSGFTLALINQEKVRHEDYNAVFWFNIIVAVACYAILFFCAPLIARFFHQPELVRLARWSFVGFVISSLGTTQNAYLIKHLMIREKSIANMLALAVSGVIGVVLAFKGFSYWAIVIQTLVLVTIVSTCYWVFSPWRPSFSWKPGPIVNMFRFGFRIMVTNMTESFGTYLYSIIFGRYYTEREVGFFNQANKWNTMGCSIVNGMFGGVAQPVLVEVGETRERLLRVFRKMVRFSAFISFPVVFGLAFIAPEFITATITDKWAASVPLLQILCIGGAFLPISHLFSNLVLSQDRPSAYMWANVALLAVQILATVVTFRLGIRAMVIAYSAIFVVWLFVWFLIVRKDIAYTLFHMLLDTLPFLVITCIAIAGAYFITRTVGNIYWLLVLKIVVTAALYALMLLATSSVTFKESVRFILKRKSS